MLAWRIPGMRACGLASCALLAACATGGESSWMDHGALMLRPSRHEVGVAFAFGGAEAPRGEGEAYTSSGIGTRIAAAMAPEVTDDRLPGAESVDFKSGRLYIHTPKKRQGSAIDWGRRAASSGRP